jgi:hypothetical protein
MQPAEFDPGGHFITNWLCLVEQWQRHLPAKDACRCRATHSIEIRLLGPPMLSCGKLDEYYVRPVQGGQGVRAAKGFTGVCVCGGGGGGGNALAS